MFVQGRDKFSERITYFIAGIFFIALIWIAVLSLQWRMQHDSPLMLYVVFLIDKFNYVPYKDIFDFNLPGTYFLYYLIGHFSDYSDLGFRIADLTFVAGITASTWMWSRQISSKAAWISSAAFGLLYFCSGPGNSLQRDFMLLLPLSVAMMFTVSFPRLNNMVRLPVVGLLGGLAFLIKPHSVLFFSAIGLYQLLLLKKEYEEFNYKTVIKTLLLYLAGFLVPNLIALLYLWQTGALPYLWHLFRKYVPLYSHISIDLTTNYGSDRLKYLIKQYFRLGSVYKSKVFWDGGSFVYWLLPASIGTFLTLRYAELSDRQKKLIYLLIALVFISTIYPVFSGQFFFYHYFLLLYFIVILSGLCFFEFQRATTLSRILSMMIFLGVFLLKMSSLPAVLEYAEGPPKGGYVDKMATIIKDNVTEGETVQPLDWTFGVVHAMLIAKVPVATPFTGDFQFYHDISNPYIQNLRKQYIKSLEKSKPKLMISITDEDHPFVSGPDTTRKFPELDNFINSYYEKSAVNSVFTVYLRK